MTTQSAYSSTSPLVMAAIDQQETELGEFNDAVKALAAEMGVPMDAMYARDSWGLVRSFAGFGVMPEVEGLTWRNLRGTYWPKKTNGAGKALARRLDKLSINFVPMPGMASRFMDGNMNRTYGLFRHDGVAWLSWSASHDVVEMNTEKQFDGTIWERRKLSEFYAAVEAHETATKSAGVR